MMGKFYLNHYKWLEVLFSIILALLFFVIINYEDELYRQLIIKKMFEASDLFFSATASLLGFVFAAITILVGLGDSFKSNNNSSKLLDIITKLTKGDNTELSIEEVGIVKNTNSASSLFFSTPAYKLTLKGLLGCVRIFSIVLICGLVIKVIGVTNIWWTTFISFYLAFSLLSIVRILILMNYIIKILTNTEKSSK